MDRLTLDTLYEGSRGSPARVFKRAVSEDPLGADAYRFLLDHVAELDVETLIGLLEARLAPEVVVVEKPFVRRLADILPEAGISSILEVLRLAHRVSPEAWIEDLTLPLKGRLLHYQWYRFVDKARGGSIFNALNVGLPNRSSYASLDPDQTFVTSIEEGRPEPLVVGLLDRAHNDLAVVDFVLRTRPVITILRLHERFPHLLKTDAVREIVGERVSSMADSWVPDEPMLMPQWMAPLVVSRLRLCGDEEARGLYEWLFALPEGSHEAEAYDVALERFKRAPWETFWHPRLGAHLVTGASWKTRGRELIGFCIDLGRGFPPEIIRAALTVAHEGAGASADEHRGSILRRIHDETARLLVERAETALKSGDYDAGDLFLSAFMSLDPGSFISGPVHHLRRIPNLPADVLARIDACEKLARAGGRRPTEDAFFEAFLVLTRRVS